MQFFTVRLDLVWIKLSFCLENYIFRILAAIFNTQLPTMICITLILISRRTAAISRSKEAFS